MALVDLENRSIVAKIVYFGPAQSGKTTSVRALYDALPEERRGAQPEFESAGEPTVFFDFVPFALGDASGFDITLRLYTVSGQEGREDARRAILTGVDGIVFVADVSAGREEENVRSMEELRQALAELHPTSPHAVPVVIQYNKLDLTDAADPDALRSALERAGPPVSYAAAIEQRGVVEALELITREVVRRL